MSDEKAKEKYQWTAKRVVAWISLIILPLLYLTTLVLALMGKDIYHPLLSACLLATLLVPLFSYVVIWLIGRYTGKEVMGDPQNSEDKDE
ncbi:MAG: hypothetical protein MJZ11_04950 [Lachnospiraceae bacterium]|nr:hypothetical protein [Lachnospiraceae bacterium]